MDHLTPTIRTKTEYNSQNHNRETLISFKDSNAKILPLDTQDYNIHCSF